MSGLRGERWSIWWWGVEAGVDRIELAEEVLEEFSKARSPYLQDRALPSSVPEEQEAQRAGRRVEMGKIQLSLT